MRQAYGLLLAAVPLLAGCASLDGNDALDRSRVGEGPVILGTHTGMPEGMRPARQVGRPVAAIVGPGRLVLTTWGSSSCPWTPEHAQELGPAAVRVVFDDVTAEPGQACTADMAPVSTRLGVDPALTRKGGVEVVVVFPGERHHVSVKAKPLARR
jgi:hypothetical protein